MSTLWFCSWAKMLAMSLVSRYVMHVCMPLQTLLKRWFPIQWMLSLRRLLYQLSLSQDVDLSKLFPQMEPRQRKPLMSVSHNWEWLWSHMGISNRSRGWENAFMYIIERGVIQVLYKCYRSKCRCLCIECPYRSPSICLWNVTQCHPGMKHQDFWLCNSSEVKWSACPTDLFTCGNWRWFDTD